jgi:hypothetical protein
MNRKGLGNHLLAKRFIEKLDNIDIGGFDTSYDLKGVPTRLVAESAGTRVTMHERLVKGDLFCLALLPLGRRCGSAPHAPFLISFLSFASYLSSSHSPSMTSEL